MTPERWHKLEPLLQAALELDPAERAVFLARECANDDALREELESLVASAPGADRFLDKSAIEDAAALLTDEEPAPLPGRQIGAYSIQEKLGSGGTGEVYLAQDTRLGRKVALKLLDTGFLEDSASRTRFLREARLASSLDHPNICTIHEVGEAAGRPFIAMQYVEGRTLRDVIGGRPLALASLLSIGMQVADALAAAHAQHIIHRDIKPGNIIVTPQGGVKVLDFGLAKLLEKDEAETDTHLTVTGAIMGTPAAMSPEQARGERADHRSDIFSFGGVMYVMATGQIPFKGRTRADVISALLREPHKPAIELNKEIPGRLSAVIDRALAKDPEDRYQSLGEMIADLRQVVAEAGGSDQLFQRERPVVPLVPILGRSELGKFSKLFPNRFAAPLLSLLIVALAVLAFVTYRSLWKAKAPVQPIQHSAETKTLSSFQSIAVLPFKPLVVRSRDEALEMGMADTLISKLGGMNQIIVRPINAVRKYAELEQDALAAGREQKVDVVLDGSIQKSADKIRVTVRLIKVADGSQLWSESFDEKFTDIFGVQDRVSEKVVGLLAVKLTGQQQSQLAKRYTDNAEAYELYVKGRYHLNRLTDDGFLKGRDYFQRAIDEDPNYALAYAGLADAYNRLSGWNAVSPLEGFPRARAAAQKALELDDKLAEAHTMLGLVNLLHDWDWAGAEREFRRALEINPGYADAHQVYSYYLSQAQGRYDEALAEMRRAQELDPLSIEKSAGIGDIFYYQRRYDQAREQYQRVLEMDPNSGFTHWLIGNVYLKEERFDDAIAEYQKAIPLSGDSPDEPASLACAYALMGKKREAQQILDELKERSKRRYISPAIIAFIYGALNEKDQAFAWLEKAYEGRDFLLVLLKAEPMFDNLRSDPRFADLVRRVGLPQ